jgi:hypothetical protein
MTKFYHWQDNGISMPIGSVRIKSSLNADSSLLDKLPNVKHTWYQSATQENFLADTRREELRHIEEWKQIILPSVSTGSMSLQVGHVTQPIRRFHPWPHQQRKPLFVQIRGVLACDIIANSPGVRGRYLCAGCDVESVLGHIQSWLGYFSFFDGMRPSHPTLDDHVLWRRSWFP